MNILKIYDKVDEAILALAEEITVAAEYAIETNGVFNFVLAGGNSPKKLYELLASNVFKNRINWDKTFFFFGDERYVPAGDERRNSYMIERALFQPLNISPQNIVELDTSLSPEQCASDYWQKIKNHFKEKPIIFDFNLLGLGDNAHTASLFPNTSVLNETKATVKSVFVQEVDMYRITMTAPLLNQSTSIAFLVFGEPKADAVFHILEDETGSIEEYPAKLIKSEGKVEWFLDQKAASRL